MLIYDEGKMKDRMPESKSASDPNLIIILKEYFLHLNPLRLDILSSYFLLCKINIILPSIKNNLRHEKNLHFIFAIAGNEFFGTCCSNADSTSRT